MANFNHVVLAGTMRGIVCDITTFFDLEIRVQNKPTVYVPCYWPGKINTDMEDHDVLIHGELVADRTSLITLTVTDLEVI